ncbi:MAG TPA: YkgJ family cysteine cluster protein [Fibrobacteria bacterium]|nr:YkgJ family cysteine cluster protein [Fibrobacteria bacterium]HOX50682.1 YkgJ family cysteine cluster protein [Fibrobacteria bacterium]
MKPGHSIQATEPPDAEDRNAGVFTSWLRRMLHALATGSDTRTPCGDCTGCCRSSQFIHIQPDEKTTLRALPKGLSFPAPGAPKGTRLLGYDDQGRCPLLADHGCTIYALRPRTCRVYDCRVFAACGLVPSAPADNPVVRRVAAWRFTHPTASDGIRHQAVREAADFLERKADLFPGGRPPSHPSQLAILALKVHEVFLESERSDERKVERIVEASRRFERLREAFEGQGKISRRPVR